LALKFAKSANMTLFKTKQFMLISKPFKSGKKLLTQKLLEKS